MRRPPTALHQVFDWAVRPGVELATFSDGSQLALFDSFKPACGYSTYWLALRRCPGTWWHVDIRNLLPKHTAAIATYAMEPALKLRAMRALLVLEFKSAQILLNLAADEAMVADPGNNELLRVGA